MLKKSHLPDRNAIPAAFSKRQIQAVHETFAKIEPMAQQTAIILYTRMFDLDPSLKALFQADAVEQGRAFMSALKVVVSNLDAMEKLVPIVAALGKKHQDHGVKPAHYDTFGFALMWTLKQSLKEDFTPEIEDACFTVYETLTTTLKQAAHTA